MIMISTICIRVRMAKTCTERRCSTSSTPPPVVPTCSHFNDKEKNLVDEEEDGVDLADEGAVVSGPHPFQPQTARSVSPNGHREPPTFEI